MIVWEKCQRPFSWDHKMDVEIDSLPLRLVGWVWQQVWYVLRLALGIYLAMLLMGA
jgi:hypothetical protein